MNKSLYKKICQNQKIMNNTNQNIHNRSAQQDQRYQTGNYQQISTNVNQQPPRGPPRNLNQFPVPFSVSQGVQGQMNTLGQQQQYMNVQKSNQGVYFPPPQPASHSSNGLISPPPQLKQQPRDSTSQMNMQTKIQHQNQSDMRDIVWGQQQQTKIFWQQKFFMIYEKFEWFGQRFQIIKSQYYNLSERLQTVDSQDDWNQLKRFHQEFGQKLEEMFQQLIAVADQNQQLINQRLGQEGQGVWQRRYHELLSNFKALQEQNAQLTNQIQHLRVQGGNNQQNQNYQELLSHYRTLQEQYDKLGSMFSNVKAENQNLIKAQGANSMGPSIQDFQNMRNQYQKNLQIMQGQYDHLKSQCQMLYEQKQHFRQQLIHQGPSSQQLKHLSQVLKQKQSQMGQIYGQLTQYKKRYSQLQSSQRQFLLTSQKQQQAIEQQKQKQLQFVKKQLEIRTSQSKQYKLKYQDQIKSLQKLNQQHQQQIQRLLKLQQQKSSHIRSTLEQQLKLLKQEVQNVHKNRNDKDLTKYQMQSYQNKIKFLKQENDQLNLEIKNKNQELIGLRSIGLKLSSYENILNQYKQIEKEKLVIEQNSRRQHYELISAKKRLVEIEHEFEQFKKYSSNSSLNRNSSTSQLKQIQQELSHQRQQVSKITSQANKYKQIIEAKQNYSRDLQTQNIKLSAKLQHQAKISQADRIQYQSQVIQLQRRIQTLQKRNRSNQLEFKKQITQNYEKQIKQLRKFNQQKIRRIKSMQQELHNYKSKSTHLEKSSSTYHRQYDLIKKKIQTLQIKNNDLITKLQLSKSTSNSLQQQLQKMKQKQILLKTQLNSFTIQIQQADNLIKNKNQIIVDYQKQVNQFIDKVSGLEKKIDEQKKYRMDRNKQYQEQIQKLKDKLYGGGEDNLIGSGGQFYSSYTNNNNRYGSSLYNSSRNLTFGTKQPGFNPQSLLTNKKQQITKLETNIIQQLNQENNKLRTQVLQITRKLNDLQTLSRVIPTIMQESKAKSPSKSKISNVNIPERDVPSGQIQQRLLKFHQRLQNCIQDNQFLSTGGTVDLTASQRIAYHERERRQMEIRHDKQIKALKQKIAILQNQINRLNASVQSVQQQNRASNNNKLFTDSQIKQFDKYEIMSQQAQKSAQQQLQFLRGKLAQQNKINSALIKLNQQIKKQLQEHLQNSNKYSTTEYYKLQWKESQKSLLEQKQRNKKLFQENKKLKHQNLEHDTKLAKEYELKLFNIEMKLTEVQRQNVYLSVNKTKGQNERANLMHDINVYSADVEAIKSNMETKISHYQMANEQLKQKCQDLQNQVEQLNLKLKKSHYSSKSQHFINTNLNHHAVKA